MTNCRVLDTLEHMMREISAGGVVVKRLAEDWAIAAIEPQKEASGSRTVKPSSQKVLLALPKGLVDPGENPAETAIREVREETGVTGSVVAKLGDIKYTYVRSWGDRQRVFKIVSFYLLRYESGHIDEVSTAMRIEVKRALWLPLHEAEGTLAYRGERDMARRALEYLTSHPVAA